MFIYLKISPNDLESEEKILEKLKIYKIKPGIELCNFLIHRRLAKNREDIKSAEVTFKI